MTAQEFVRCTTKGCPGRFREGSRCPVCVDEEPNYKVQALMRHPVARPSHHKLKQKPRLVYSKSVGV